MLLAVSHSISSWLAGSNYYIAAFVFSLVTLACASELYRPLPLPLPSLATLLAHPDHQVYTGLLLLEALLIHVPASAWRSWSLTTTIKVLFFAVRGLDAEGVAIVVVGLLAFTSWGDALQGPGYRGDAVTSCVLV